MSKTLLDICVMKEAINVRECKRARACVCTQASVSAFQESRDQSGKPDGGEKWQDKICAERAHVQKKRVRVGVGVWVGGRGAVMTPTYETTSAPDHRCP